MGLIEAQNLFLLLGVPILGSLIYLRIKLKQQRLSVFSEEAAKTFPRKKLIFLPILVIATILFALARPHAGSESTKLKLYGRDIIAVVDVSLSMLTKDIPPSRLTFAKRKLIDLLELIKHQSAGDRLGIVIYAGESQLFSPLTSDYGILKLYIDALSPKLMQNGGSDIEGAIEAAIKGLQSTNSLSENQNKNPILLLISDGEDNEFALKNAVTRLKEVSLPLYALGVGTLDGKPIELDNGSFLRDRHGDTVISRLQEENLKRLAEESGGQYQRAQLDDSDIKTILESSAAQQSKSSIERNYIVYREIGPLFLAALLLLLTAVFAFRKEPLLFPVVLCISLPFVSNLQAQPPETAYEANKAYQAGDYENARLGFKQALEKDPLNQKLLQGLASSEFRLKNYEEASKLFSELYSQSKTGRDKFNALYNLGNSYLASQKPSQAIDAYDQALSIKPDDEKAEFNRGIAKQMLESSSSSQSTSSSSASSSQTSSNSTQSESESNSLSSSPASSQSSEGKSGESSSQSTGSESSTKGSSGSEGSSTQSGGSSMSTGSEGSGSGSNGTGSGGSSQNSSGAQDADDAMASPLPTYDPKALKEQEAKDWLDSLSDSPIITYKNQRRNNRSQAQDW